MNYRMSYASVALVTLAVVAASGCVDREGRGCSAGSLLLLDRPPEHLSKNKLAVDFEDLDWTWPRAAGTLTVEFTYSLDPLCLQCQARLREATWKFCPRSAGGYGIRLASAASPSRVYTLRHDAWSWAFDAPPPQYDSFGSGRRFMLNVRRDELGGDNIRFSIELLPDGDRPYNHIMRTLNLRDHPNAVIAVEVCPAVSLFASLPYGPTTNSAIEGGR